VEEWRLKNGTTVLEVSYTATDDGKDKSAFFSDVAIPLLKAIVPLDRSKESVLSSHLDASRRS
jgi:hypothetical protein